MLYKLMDQAKTMMKCDGKAAHLSAIRGKRIERKNKKVNGVDKAWNRFC